MGVDSSKVNLYALAERGLDGVSASKSNVYILFQPAQPLAYAVKANLYAAVNDTSEGNQAASKVNFYVLIGPPVTAVGYKISLIKSYRVPFPIPDLRKFGYGR